MNQREYYLDNSATTPVLPEAAKEAARVMTRDFGNPSSLHTKGFLAKKELEAARSTVASRLGARPEELVFTSGGTEANNLALLGAAMARRKLGNKIVTTALEHDSVLKPLKALESQGFAVEYLAPDESGAVSGEQLAGAIDKDTILVSLMLCNNETGAIFPVREAARAIKRQGAPALLHTDCVQAFCKLDFTPQKLGADLCTVSGHKIHAPKGVGALYVRQGAHILPQILGGGQERGLRSGTESLPLLAAFAKVVELAPRPAESLAHVEALNQMLRERLTALPEVEINSPAGALPYILNFSALGVRAETMLHFLSGRGVYVSSGSACGKAKPSHVLAAMGLSKERISSALRVSFSRFSTQEDVEALAEGVQAGLEGLMREKRERRGADAV